MAKHPVTKPGDTNEEPQLNPWRRLENELDRWAEQGRRADFWWRTDDAAKDCEALRRLLAIDEAYSIGMGLAVVPEWVDQEFVRLLEDHSAVGIFQHGFRHKNYGRPGAPATELGGQRPLEMVGADLRRGRHLLEDLFGRRFSPIIVPPWMHVDQAVVDHLVGWGYRGISLFNARPAVELSAGLHIVNCHCDPIRWKQKPPRFSGINKVVGFIVNHLAARRTQQADTTEATGLLTHHLDHDEATWAFVEELARRIDVHPAAHWISAEVIFPGPIS